MIGKLSFLAGFGAGYVLGARAGRRRYDEMVDMAQRLWRDPRVQEKAEQAQHLAQEKAEQAGHAVKEKAEQAGHAVKEKVTGSQEEPDPMAP